MVTVTRKAAIGFRVSVSITSKYTSNITQKMPEN